MQSLRFVTVRMDNRTLKCKMDFEGNIYPSNYGDFRVLEFTSKTHVLIEFVTTSYQKVTTLNQVRSGEVKDPYYPSICGVGYVGEGVYPITCVYIPQVVNSLFGGTSTNISGVTFNKLKKAWEVQIHNGKTNKSGERYQSYLGTYPDIETATKVYRSAKISYVRNIALLYQERIPAALFYKLYLGAENYVDYYMYQKEYEIENN